MVRLFVLFVAFLPASPFVQKTPPFVQNSETLDKFQKSFSLLCPAFVSLAADVSGMQALIN
jgi:hypothetical protein